MDEAFQLLMPLEQNTPVFSIVYPGGETAVAPQPGSGDFFQLLIDQLTASMNPEGQGTVPGMVPFDIFTELPLIMPEGEQQEMQASSENGTMYQTPGTFPFITIISEEGKPVPLFSMVMNGDVPGGDALPEGSQPGDEQLVTVLEGDVPLVGETAFSQAENVLSAFFGMEETSEVNVPHDGQEESESSFLFNSPSLETSAHASGEQQPSNDIKSLVDLFASMANKPLMPTEGMVENQERLEQFVFERPPQESTESPVLKELGELQSVQTEYLSNNEGTVPYADLLLQSSFVMLQEIGTGEQGKGTHTETHSFPHSVGFLSDFGVSESPFEGVIPVEGGQPSFDDAKFSMQSQTFFDTPGDEEFSPVTSTESEAQFETALDERVRQAQEAQSIAQQMVKSATLRQGATFSEMKLTLEPEYLGNLRLRIAVEDDAVFAKITTDNMHTRDVLQNNMGILKDSLEEAGINLNNVEVLLDDGEEGFAAFHEEHGAPKEGHNDKSSSHELFSVEEEVDSFEGSQHDGTVIASKYYVNFLA